MKELAVIILNWNGVSLLKQFLPTAAEHTIDEDTDLIVADNGSDDGSVAWMQREMPQIRIIRLDRNYGFAEGYNRAIREAGYKYSLLLNSDVEVTPGWTRPLLAFMREHPDVAAVQPKIRSFRHREMFEYAGAAGGYIDRLGYPYCRGRLFDCVERDEGQYDGEPADICWASGAALLVRTDEYFAAGGLDADFFAHMEEIDLCCRIHARGWRICCVPDSMVFHVGGASLDKSDPRKTYLNFRNNLLLLHKNMPRREGRKLLLRRRLMDTLAFMMYAAKFKFRHAAAVLRAHRDFRRMRRKYTDLPQHEYMSRLPGAQRNIIVDRYLRGMKK